MQNTCQVLVSIKIQMKFLAGIIPFACFHQAAWHITAFYAGWV